MVKSELEIALHSRKTKQVELLPSFKGGLDIDYKMPIGVELSSEEAALQMYVALVLGELFKINESG